MLVPIPQPKPTGKPREAGAVGARPPGRAVSEPTHSIALREKQPRRAGMERAGGGKKTKTETELGGREGVLGFHPQVRQGEEEEFFPLHSLGPDPLNPGGAAFTLESTGSVPAAHPIDPSSKCSSFGGRTAGRWGGGSGGVPTLQPPTSRGALQTRLPSPAAVKSGDRVPRNLAAALSMLSSHSRQISLYLPAKWARGAFSDDDCAGCRELGATGRTHNGSL